MLLKCDSRSKLKSIRTSGVVRCRVLQRRRYCRSRRSRGSRVGPEAAWARGRATDPNKWCIVREATCVRAKTQEPVAPKRARSEASRTNARMTEAASTTRRPSLRAYPNGSGGIQVWFAHGAVSDQI